MAVYIRKPNLIHYLYTFTSGTGQTIHALECGGEVDIEYIQDKCETKGNGIYHTEWFSFSFYDRDVTCENCLHALKEGTWINR